MQKTRKKLPRKEEVQGNKRNNFLKEVPTEVINGGVRDDSNKKERDI